MHLATTKVLNETNDNLTSTKYVSIENFENNHENMKNICQTMNFVRCGGFIEKLNNADKHNTAQSNENDVRIRSNYVTN